MLMAFAGMMVGAGTIGIMFLICSIMNSAMRLRDLDGMGTRGKEYNDIGGNMLLLLLFIAFLVVGVAFLSGTLGISRERARAVEAGVATITLDGVGDVSSFTYKVGERK